MTKIKGRNDGLGGRSEHPDAHIVKINDREYARDNPDKSKKDNVNR